jgi:hypothetical protein
MHRGRSLPIESIVPSLARGTSAGVSEAGKEALGRA